MRARILIGVLLAGGVILLSHGPIASSVALEDGGDCNWAGTSPSGGAVMSGGDWPGSALADNQIGIGFGLSRPIGEISPGSWSMTVDWGDGDVQTFGTSADVPSGPFPPPPQGEYDEWIVHTYARGGNYAVHITTSGHYNEISDGSGQEFACSDDYTFDYIIPDRSTPGVRWAEPPQTGGGGGGGGPGKGGTGGTGNSAKERCLAKAQEARELALRLHTTTQALAGAAFLLALGFQPDDFAALGSLFAGHFRDELPEDIARHVTKHANREGERGAWQVPDGTKAQKEAAALAQVEEVLSAPDRDVVIRTPDRGATKGMVIVEISTPPKNGVPGRLLRFARDSKGFRLISLGVRKSLDVGAAVVAAGERAVLLPAAAVATLAAGLTAMGEITASLMAAVYNHCAKRARGAASASVAAKRKRIRVPGVRVPRVRGFGVTNTLSSSSARAATVLARNLVAQAAYARALKRELGVLRKARRTSAKAVAYRKAARREARRLAKLMKAGRRLRVQAVAKLGLGTVTFAPTTVSRSQAARLVRLAQPLFRATGAPSSTARKLRGSLVRLAAEGGSLDLRSLLASPALSGYETAEAQALVALAKAL